MTKKRLLYVLVIICCAFWATNAFPATYQQPAGLFKIDIPQGWRIQELSSGEISISSPDGYSDIKIEKPAPITSEEEAKKRTASFIQSIKEMTPKFFGGVLIAEKEVVVGGLSATLIEFNTSRRERSYRNGTVCFYAKGHIFSISFLCIETDRPQIGQIINTFQVQ